MKIMIYRLPQKLWASSLLSFLGDLSRFTDVEISLDFSDLARITPAGLTAIAATVLRWRRQGKEVETPRFRRVGSPDIFSGWICCGYAGFDSGTFSATRIQRTIRSSSAIDHRVEEMGHSMAACLAPGGEEYDHPLSDLYELAWYVLTETANNARQHSDGIGCIAAQVTPGDGLVASRLLTMARESYVAFRMPVSHGVLQ